MMYVVNNPHLARKYYLIGSFMYIQLAPYNNITHFSYYYYTKMIPHTGM